MVDWITAIATCLVALFTLGLVAVAWWQLHKAVQNQRKWATLQTCDRYDSDFLIQSAVKALRQRRNSPTPQVLRMHAVRLFNYFDSIAIGLKQEFYVEEIARDHLKRIILSWYDDVIGYPPSKIIPLEDAQRDFADILSLIRKWQQH